uniref:Ras-related protein Rab n=1 Tax=Cyclopterus lumpus TaxID=8103 RepID=A0A8C2WW66_CYCLU
MRGGAATMQQELLFKVLVIGDLGVGKTSIIKRYVHQIFSQHYRATIGVDFALKVLQWNNDTVIRLQLWDIAGQERYGNMTRVYYREAVGALVVFDVTRASTFDAVLKWKDDLDSKVTLNHGRPVPAVLLANKCDQLAPQQPKLDSFCRENGFVGWFETSAKVREGRHRILNTKGSEDKQQCFYQCGKCQLSQKSDFLICCVCHPDCDKGCVRHVDTDGRRNS